MEIIVFLSIGIAVLAVLTSIFLVRRVKKQIAEMTDALVDVKNGNGNLDLCQYFGHKKLKGYADFFNSSSSFCCGVI